MTEGVILDEKNILKRMKAKAAKADLRSQAEKDVDEALAKSALAAKRKEERKFQMKLAAAAGVFLVLAYGVWLVFFSVTKGTKGYGLCKTFLELNVQYPSLLRISTVEIFDTSARIWFTQFDSFGDYRMEPIQCYFKIAEDGTVSVDRILISRREVDPKKVQKFNVLVPMLLANPPDLTLPDPLPDSLEDVQIQTDQFRKPLF